MNHIAITHNPFLVETTFLIDGLPPADNSNITQFANKRLQVWVEQFFDELEELFNGSKEFSIEFTGVESDYNDIKEVADNARKKGMNIELKFNCMDPAEKRLEDIKTLMKRVCKESSEFAKYIESDSKVKKDYEDALNNDFDIYVVATMSSGKSTFINAILGRDLLPAANEATTATIAQIIDDKSYGENFYGERYDGNGKLIGESKEAVDLKTMKAWNSDSETKSIILTGNIRAIKENPNVRLVLTDTPGPNNSQDPEHERTTLGFIQDSNRNPLIIYVLNATQLGTKDDHRLLKLVSETMRKGGKQSKDRFLFVVNKMDAFDPERGENIKEALDRVKSYLVDNGIQEPKIYPISARMAYLLRKQGELTRQERRDKTGIADLLLEEKSMALPQYMPLSKSVELAVSYKAEHDEALQDKTMSRALLNSGLPGVEAVIDEYVNKYSFPMRINRAYEAMTAAIENGLQEANLNKQLEIDEKELSKLKEEIQKLRARRELSFNTKSYKEKLQKEGRDLPIKVHNELLELENKARVLLHEIGNNFSGEVSVSEAEQLVDEASKDIQFKFNQTINDYESAFQGSQELIKKELIKEYKKHVAALFSDSGNLELPVFQSIKDTISAIPFNIEISQNDIYQKPVVIGRRTVSDSKWYNPFSWGRTHQEDISKDEDFVDLKEIWQMRGKDVIKQYQDLRKQAIEHIQEDNDKLVENYLNFLDGEFDAKFDAILNDLAQKADNYTKREQAIAKANENIKYIRSIKSKLEAILEFKTVSGLSEDISRSLEG